MTLRPTDGVAVDESEQGSAGWMAARVGMFGASQAGNIMIRNKDGSYTWKRKDYLNQLALERITGELTETVTTQAMQEGIDREPVAALAYSFEKNVELLETGFWHKDYWGASPDRLIAGQKGGVEIKNPKAATHYNTLLSRDIPEHYYWQVIQNMLITGAEFWDFVSYHPNFPANAQLFIKRVERKDVGDDLLALRTELSKANQEVEAIVEQINQWKGEVEDYVESMDTARVDAA